MKGQFVLALLAVTACKSDPAVVQHDVAPSSSASTAVVVASATATATTSATDPVPAILQAPDLAAAIKVTKPLMIDTRDDSSRGAIQLSLWAMKHLVWSDVGIPKNETKLALVHKDPDEERGKRLCVGGSLIQIEVEKTALGKLNIGLLRNDADDLVHFLAAGSSGTLVKGSPARLCGVVTGLYDYGNSGGGTGHAVEIVGMFDLPANKK